VGLGGLRRFDRVSTRFLPIKSVSDSSAQDASAALPQNCQTTKWIVVNYSFQVNVTLVIGIFLLEKSERELNIKA
jgi:hypothetical protein